MNSLISLPAPPKDLMSFIFQYVVWKVSKNALKEYSKKEEVFVLGATLFFPTGLLFCPSPLLSLPPKKAVKQRETVRNQRLQVHVALVCTFEAIS